MWKIREIQDKVTNVVMNYTEVESKVREATNDDQWGPHGTAMAEIAKYTYTYEHFPEVMGMIWKRMLHEKKNWRRVYKCLLLLSYLIRNGSERVVSSARDHIYDMRQLESYQHVDELGKDQGLNIRHKVKEVLDIIQDDQKLRDERKRSKQNKDKYVGMSSDVIEDSFYSDRYNRDARRSPNYSGGYTGNNFQQKSKIQQIKETIDTIRPGKRDYSEYNLPAARGNAYKDEPEDGQEVVEDYQDSDDEGSYKYKSSEQTYSDSPQKTTETKKSPTRKIDLGAAATFANSSQNNAEIVSTSNDNSDFAEFHTAFSNAPPAQPSTMDELADVLTSPLPQPAIVPISSNPSSSAQIDLFGDFSTPAPAAPTQQTTNQNFAQFESFDSLNKPASNSNDLLFGDLNSSNMMSSVQQPTNVMQPNLMGQANIMQQSNTLPQNNAMIMSQQQNTNLMQSNISSSQPMNASSDKNKATLWSNTGVNISLDSLSPGANRNKPAMPSMNQMSGQSFVSPAMQQPMMMGQAYNTMPQQPQYGMPQQQNMMMANMNLGMSPQMRMQMQPNMGMQSNMAMRPNMGLQQPMNRQMGMGNNIMSMQQMGMTSQTQMNQNFAQFKAS